MPFKIKHDVKACIGCGACVSACPSNWEMIDTPDGQKSRAKKDVVKELGCNKEAEEVCPVQCIKIVEA